MTNREKPPTTGVQQQVPTDVLVWTKVKFFTGPNVAYCAELTIGDSHRIFVVDQPRKGRWVARGWTDGDFSFYRDSIAGLRTLKAMKAAVADEVQRLLAGHERSTGGRP